MKKNKISKNWVNKQRRDTYVRQSKVDGYRARSAYKLIEIDEKFKMFKGGMIIVDIGSAPGSWSQYAAKKVKSGKIISISHASNFSAVAISEKPVGIDIQDYRKKILSISHKFLNESEKKIINSKSSEIYY